MSFADGAPNWPILPKPRVSTYTPLHDLHQRLQAKLVPFAGYEMPVQYPTGIVAEHLHTREAAGLFDVSHMGQAILTGRDHDSVARAIESWCRPISWVSSPARSATAS
jgi:hypothetical protein